jgi:mRNA-degrading endonuclease RelE of RelBE toxin-antitoxin system
MEKYKKFLLKLNPALRKRLLSAIDKIANGRVAGLDIKKLHNKIPVYRCRVGKVRILFEKTEDGNRILEIRFRGDAY